MFLGAPFSAITPLLKSFGPLGLLSGLVLGAALSDYGVLSAVGIGAAWALLLGVWLPWSTLLQQKRCAQQFSGDDRGEPWWAVERTRVAELSLSSDQAFEFCARELLRRHPGGKLLDEYRRTGSFGDKWTKISLMPLGPSRTEVRVDLHLPGLQRVDADCELLRRAEEGASILHAHRGSSA